MSGGGGWGAKQGLLSLDPQTTYTEIPEARFDFSQGTMAEQQASALGNLAQEGAFIQFFAAYDKHIQGEPVRFDHVATRGSIVLGSVPSTVDDIAPSQTLVAPPEGEKLYHLKSGHFGFVSESGVFVHHGFKKPNVGSNPDPLHVPSEHFTKIDLPHSYMYRDFLWQRTNPGNRLIRRVKLGRVHLYYRL